MKFFSFKISKKFCLIFLSALSGLILFFCGLLFANNNRVVFGAQIAGLNLGGKDFFSAENKLKTQLANYQKTEVSIFGTSPFQISFSDLGLEIEERETWQNLISFGHQNNIFLNLTEQLYSLFTKPTIKIAYSINLKKFNQAMLLFSSQEKEPRMLT